MDRAIELLEEQQRKVKGAFRTLAGGGAAERYLPPGAAQRGNPGAGPGKRLHVHYGGGEENQGFCGWAQERRLWLRAAGEADAILREFYGLGAPRDTATESGSPKILNLADFL